MLTLALKSYAKYSRQNGVHESPCTLVNGILEPKTSPCARPARSIVPSPTLCLTRVTFRPLFTRSDWTADNWREYIGSLISSA